MCLFVPLTIANLVVASFSLSRIEALAQSVAKYEICDNGVDDDLDGYIDCDDFHCDGTVGQKNEHC